MIAGRRYQILMPYAIFAGGFQESAGNAYQGLIVFLRSASSPTAAGMDHQILMAIPKNAGALQEIATIDHYWLIGAGAVVG